MSPLQAALLLAQSNQPGAVEKLRKILDAYPGIWRHYGDAARAVEEAWIGRIAGSDLLVRESLRHSIDQMRKDLAGPEPTPLEKLLVGRVIAAWLAAQEADLSDALLGGQDGRKVAELRIRRSDAAHKRFLSAAKTLATVRRLQDGMKIRVEHVGMQAASERHERVPMGGRMGSLMAETADAELAVAGSKQGG